MFRYLLLTAFILPALSAKAQQKEGRVLYQRVRQLNVQVYGNAALPNNLPQSMSHNFELNFSGNRGSWKQVSELATEEAGGPGFVLRMSGGADDLSFFDLDTEKRVRQTELAGKNYLITDSIRKSDWKLTGETKTILGHPCQQATTTRIGSRTMMAMENGNMIRKTVSDTTEMIAWFTTDISVAMGPEYQGQLPGLILELSSADGKTVYTALEISAKPDKSTLKEPTKGKKITGEEFTREQTKMVEEMQRNGPPGGAGFRFSQ